MSARHPSTARVLLRTALTAPLQSATIVIVVALLTLIGASAPALLAIAQDRTVQAAADDMSAQSRDLTNTAIGAPVPSTGDDPWADAEAQLAAIADALPPQTKAIAEAPRMQVTRMLGTTLGPDVDPANRVDLRFAPDIMKHVTIVDGAEPQTGTGSTWHVMASVAVATKLGWKIGDERTVRGSPGTTLILDGTFEPRDQTDPSWTYFPSALHTVRAITSDDAVLETANLFAAPRDYARLDPAALGATTSDVWIPLPPAQITSANATQLAQEVRRASGTPYAFDRTDEFRVSPTITLTSDLGTAIESGLTRSIATTAVLLAVAVGPVAVALVALALAARLLADRRATSVRLMQARGASPRWIATVFGGEGLLLGLCGVVIGLSITALLGGWAGLGSVFVGVVLGLVPAIILPLTASAEARGHERRDLGVDVGARRGRRWALEAIVVVLSGGIIWAVASRPEPVSGLDPLLIALPLALSAIATVIVMRVLPAFLTFAERTGARSAGLVPLLGPARARRDPAVRMGPVLAVIVGIAVSIFSVAYSATVSEGIRTQAGSEAGADLRVVSRYISADTVEDIRALDGVKALAGIYYAGTEKLVGDRKTTLVLYGIDPQEFAAVQDASHRTDFPVELLSAAGDVPLIVSQPVGENNAGSGLPLTLGYDVPVTIAATFVGPDPFGATRQWALVDRSHISDITHRSADASQLFLALTPDADLDAITDAISQRVEGASFIAPKELIDRRSADPAVNAVTWGVGAAILIAAGLLAICVAMTLVLGSRSRTRLIALLRTFGYRNRNNLRLVVWEVAPAMLIALPFGIAVGIAMSFIVTRALDLSGFVGGGRQPELVWGAQTQLLVVAGFLAIAAISVLVATALAARLSSASAVRSGDEEGRS